MIHGDLLGERARVSPERTALVTVTDGRRYSYRELDQRAVGCARMWLYGLGLRPGDRVAILSGNRVELLDAFFAAGSGASASAAVRAESSRSGHSRWGTWPQSFTGWSRATGRPASRRWA